MICWTGSPLIGINCLQPFGYGVSSGGAYLSNPFANGGADSVVMPASRLQLIASTGFDFVRMAVDPGPLCAAANDTILGGLVSQIVTGIQARVAAGLRVIVDMHVINPSSLPGWGTYDFIDGPTGPKFSRLVYCAVKLGTAIVAAGLTPHQVAFELFNEPAPSASYTGSSYPTQIASYFSQLRAVMPGYCLIIQGNCGYLDNFQTGNSSDGMVALNPASFDAQTIFAWHSYEPISAALQGTPGLYQDVHRLYFPPQNHPGGLAAANNCFTAATMLDTSLSPTQQQTNIQEFTQYNWSFSFPPYFNTPEDQTWVANRYAVATAWAARNSVPLSRIGVTEFGINGDLGNSLGADSTSITAFIHAHRDTAFNAGIGFITIHELQGSGFAISSATSPFAFNQAALSGLRLP